MSRPGRLAPALGGRSRPRVPLVVASVFTSGLSSLSCVSAWQCTAGTLEGPVIREVNGSWSQPTKLVSQAQFPQVSCTSGTFCGYLGNGRFASFNGSSWSKNKLLFPSFLPYVSTLDTALACSGASLCVAADDTGDVAVGTP